VLWKSWARAFSPLFPEAFRGFSFFFFSVLCCRKQDRPCPSPLPLIFIFIWYGCCVTISFSSLSLFSGCPGPNSKKNGFFRDLFFLPLVAKGGPAFFALVPSLFFCSILPGREREACLIRAFSPFWKPWERESNVCRAPPPPLFFLPPPFFPCCKKSRPGKCPLSPPLPHPVRGTYNPTEFDPPPLFFPPLLPGWGGFSAFFICPLSLPPKLPQRKIFR